MAHTKLETIDIVFENCDYVRIDASDIKIMSFEDVKNKTQLSHSAELLDMNIASNTIIILSPSANKEYFEFGQDGNENFKNTVFNRIKAERDITQITLNTVDENGKKTQRDMYVDWEGDNDYINPAQHIVEYKEGYLGLFIDRKFSNSDAFFFCNDKGKKIEYKR